MIINFKIFEELNIKPEIGDWVIWDNPLDFMEEEIINFSKNKEDLEYIIAANKYNL
jgi:hypothetical protein